MKSHSSSPSQPFITSIFILILLPVSLLYAAPEEVDKVSQFFNFLLLPRVWVSLILSLAGLALLMRFKVKKNLRLLFMFLTFFVFAIFPSLPLGSITVGMGLHPSPVCTTTKPFLFMNAGRDVPMIFLSILFSILVLSIIGNKLFCGWACPIGALQEIFNRIPIPEKLRIKLPFRYTNAFRTVVYIAYIPLVFLTGIGIYDFFNPFETLHWPPALYGGIVLGITVIASLFIYRPFCYLLCPIGLITWLAEHIAFIKIKVDKVKCTDCQICLVESPCPSMNAILYDKKTHPDCHACARCIESCPEDAISFRR